MVEERRIIECVQNADAFSRTSSRGPSKCGKRFDDIRMTPGAPKVWCSKHGALSTRARQCYELATRELNKEAAATISVALRPHQVPSRIIRPSMSSMMSGPPIAQNELIEELDILRLESTPKALAPTPDSIGLPNAHRLSSSLPHEPGPKKCNRPPSVDSDRYHSDR